MVEDDDVKSRTQNGAMLEMCMREAVDEERVKAGSCAPMATGKILALVDRGEEA